MVGIALGVNFILPPALGGVGGAASPDFSLTNASVVTAWGLVTVGELTPINAPAGVTFRIKESAGASGDDAGFAVVNG